MDFTQKKGFKKAVFGGFSKADVNSYLAETVLKYTSELENAEKKFSEKEEECSSLAALLRDAEDKITRLTKISEEAAALRAKYDALVAEHELTSTKLAEKSALADELSGQVTALSAIEAEYAARKTELADIEISARARASEIIAEADAEADARRRQLDDELALRRRDFDERREAAFREVGDTAAGVSRIVDSLRLEVESMEGRITRIADSVRNNVTSLADAVCDAQDKVSNIRSRILGEDEE